MAREHARIQSAIWQDPDFLQLPGSAQRLYLFLLSQPNLTHLGVLPLTLRRWVKSTPGYTIDLLCADLQTLNNTRYIVVDEDAEELLIRTLLRGDGVYKQPNVMRSAISSAKALHSHRIKRAVLAELDRIDLTAMSESRQTEVEGLIADLREVIAVPTLVPTEDPPRTPTGTPSEGSTEPLPEPQAIPPTHARARPLPLSLSPTPSPTTSPTGRDEPASAANVVGAYVEGATTSGRPRPSGKLTGKIGRDAKRLLGEGVPLDELVIAARSCGQRGWDDLDRERQLPTRGKPVSNGRASATPEEYEDLAPWARGAS